MRGLFEERLTRNDVGSAVRTTGVIICPSDEWSAQRTLLGNPQIQELRGTRTMGNALRSGGCRMLWVCKTASSGITKEFFLIVSCGVVPGCVKAGASAKLFDWRFVD